MFERKIPISNGIDQKAYKIFAIFSIMFKGIFRILVKGPRGWMSSLRVFVSVLLMAPSRGAKIRYMIK